jgi:hypothetical protein
MIDAAHSKYDDVQAGFVTSSSTRSYSRTGVIVAIQFSLPGIQVTSSDLPKEPISKVNSQACLLTVSVCGASVHLHQKGDLFCAAFMSYARLYLQVETTTGQKIS